MPYLNNMWMGQQPQGFAAPQQNRPIQPAQQPQGFNAYSQYRIGGASPANAPGQIPNPQMPTSPIPNPARSPSGPNAPNQIQAPPPTAQTHEALPPGWQFGTGMSGEKTLMMRGQDNNGWTGTSYDDGGKGLAQMVEGLRRSKGPEFDRQKQMLGQLPIEYFQNYDPQLAAQAFQGPVNLR